MGMCCSLSSVENIIFIVVNQLTEIMVVLVFW
jgi:hypothetical protein